MMKKILILTLSLVVFISCEKEKPIVKEYKATMNNVLRVHDEVMPEMGELNNLITQMQDKIDAGKDSETHQNALNNLKGSHAFMMEWMRDFAEKFPNALKEPTFSEDQYEQKLNTLKAEEKEVMEMKRRIESSMAEAKELL